MGKLFVIEGTDGSGKQTQFEKLKEKKFQEYQKAVMKADELFIEEFVSNTTLREKRQYS